MQFVDYPLQESEILYEVPVSRGDDKKIEPPMRFSHLGANIEEIILF